MHESGYFIRGIARELKMSRQTITKYLRPDVTAVHGAYVGKRSSEMLEPYVKIIQQSMSQKLNSVKIEQLIKEQGYIGSASALRKYISALRKNSIVQYKETKGNNDNIKFIERKFITKLLYKPLDSSYSNLNDELFELFELFESLCN